MTFIRTEMEGGARGRGGGEGLGSREKVDINMKTALEEGGWKREGERRRREKVVDFAD